VPTPPQPTQESEEELSQPVVNLKPKQINLHLPSATPGHGYDPLDYVLYEKQEKITVSTINKNKSAENMAKQTTPAQTRQKTKMKATSPMTLKKAKTEIYYDTTRGAWTRSSASQITEPS